MLLKKLKSNETSLLSTHASLILDVKAKSRITPAGEWLLDNFYVIEEQISLARSHLPAGYSLGLPFLVNGPSAWLPRIYDIANEIVTHSDGGLDMDNLGPIFASYQSVAVLNLGELWAFPIMLRLALIEELTRNADLIMHQRKGRILADHWADRMIATTEKSPKDLILTLSDMAVSNPALTSAFVSELTRRLHGQGATLAIPLAWMEQQIVDAGVTGAQLIEQENRFQAENQVSMGNCIASLRLLATMDWKEFVETMSCVEQTLRTDRNGTYARMDFTTRDRYRHVIEAAARYSCFPESVIAQKAIDLAADAALLKGDGDRTAHVGYYLINRGLRELDKSVRVRRPICQRIQFACKAQPLTAYLGGIAALTAVSVAIMANLFTGGTLAVFFWALSIICGGQLAIALVNWLATLAMEPHALPRMDFSGGIPHDCRTLVAVPAMLVNPSNIETLFEDLEVRFLANRDDALHFCLLTDFTDAASEKTPQDKALLRLARRKTKELNDKYRSLHGDVFFLFHRPRLWNPEEKLWMGYERKRGKIADLNSILRGGSTDKFSLIVGETSILGNVKYVIILDADTKLSRDSAWQFIATMAHPLNRPCFVDGRVEAGYGILQPRVATMAGGGAKSRYARMSASEVGIDPYTRSVSDVYQDLFGEGSFIGKGIYDVDAFERMLSGTFPDNRILSHDLLEGCYIRSGLLSDVQLYEAAPSSYLEDSLRRHRWVRGDWQVASWILPRVPGADSHAIRNPLSMLSRWKVFDNLRRSLTGAALTFLLLLGWVCTATPGFWTMAAIGIMIIPSLFSAALDTVNKRKDMGLKQHLLSAARLVRRQFYYLVFQTACLPFEAFYHLDAILRTSWRLLASRRLMLQWRPSSSSTSASSLAFGRFFGAMYIGPVLSIAAAGAILAVNPAALFVAAPLLLLWLISPVLAWRISQPTIRRGEELTVTQRQYLRKIARKTWEFFETHVTAESNWLPPDNHQDYPTPKTAHRTSPTNMGLALLVNLSAYDLGSLSCGRLVDRTTRAFAAMGKLERYRGHFLNWYDTKTLESLKPRYVSSVDSGNLSGHLLALAPGLAEISGHDIINKNAVQGLLDLLSILQDEVETSLVAPKLARLQQDITRRGGKCTATLTASQTCFSELISCVQQTKAELIGYGFQPDHSSLLWLESLLKQCRDALTELEEFAPWLVTMKTFGNPPAALNAMMTFGELEGLERGMEQWFVEQAAKASTKSEQTILAALKTAVAQGSQNARSRLSQINTLVAKCEEYANIEYNFLYDKSLHLLRIGYNIEDGRCDPSCYDLLASESRLATFLGVAQRKIPIESWFAMGRLLSVSGGDPILLSWSGSMFEYLMPLLVIPGYENTLLDETCKSAVARQIAYGEKRAIPWGISECGYNLLDERQDYQYRAFGVPGLGLKRGLSDDVVIAPYATALALMVDVTGACRNLERLSREGFETRYGFYEAVDYTASRLPPGKSNAAVQSYMAHHQGMSLVSLANVLLDYPMQKRFTANPVFKAASLLLHERVPESIGTLTHTASYPESPITNTGQEAPVRTFENPNTDCPEVQLLSNGRYHVMVTNSGGGYSRWRDLAVTRWREDKTRDNWGTFCYLRDAASGEFWSTTYQPTTRAMDHYQAIFSEGRAEFHCSRNSLDAHTEIAVSPEDDVELRRITITNRGRTRRTLDVTSYGETVMTPQAADESHPAFSNLFVQSEIMRDRQAILSTRRKRDVSETPPSMLHMMTVHGADTENVSFETERGRFLGRGRTAYDPQAMRAKSLSGGDGSVLDPIVSVRCLFTLAPGETATVYVMTGVAASRDAGIALAEKYRDRFIADRVFDLAWTHAQVLLRQLNSSESDAQMYNRLAGSVLYANLALRAEPTVLADNRSGQSGLWSFSISGDLPLVLLRVEDIENIRLVQTMVQAHAYWRLKGLAVDLVIWNEDQQGYRQLLQERIGDLVRASPASPEGRFGEIFVRSAEQISESDRILIQTVARVIVSDAKGTLAEQLKVIRRKANIKTPFGGKQLADPVHILAASRPDLRFYNGYGGFTQDGKEYIIECFPGHSTPTPWINVLANPEFGSVVSESGMAYTWGENSHEYRLTPWSNDPVSDSTGEAFYLRDEDSGVFWSPTPQPVPGEDGTLTRHGFGYSVFEKTRRGVHTELTSFVAVDAPVKFVTIKVRNDTNKPVRLSITGYMEWILGDLKSKYGMHVVTETDPLTGALMASNPYNTDFPQRVAFFTVDSPTVSLTGDRSEFIGRNMSIANPAGMVRENLSGKVGAGLDACGVLRAPLELSAGEERTVVFKLGMGKNPGEVKETLSRFCGPAAAREALLAVHDQWSSILGAVQVETPDSAFNIMANGWLLYQTLSCRLWGRTATYQSGGAFGFRDQLQDVLALLHARPDSVRKQLLLAASRQFPEGDAQHWWHPPTGRGVRTHCSDDYLWLPFVAAAYVFATGDTGVMDEDVGFIEGRMLRPEEESNYDLPSRSNETASLYEHCLRALRNGLKFGIHGLPLMGSGDWNDGMDKVGEQGRGESVWLGFFLYKTLSDFARIAEMRNDVSSARHCRDEAKTIRENIQKHGWDGSWYLRAFFDDGTRLGTAGGEECRIDSIAQSWSVLSGGGDHDRSRKGMHSVYERLVDQKTGIVKLFTPPFDVSSLNPGYIKGYVPGVRENGGQYTHAAIWAGMAFAALGDETSAWRLMELLNPINHSFTVDSADKYKIEPYVVAADVYASEQHAGRGGWSWYTGSASWMYRFMIESLLGIERSASSLKVSPCLPAAWSGIKIRYRYYDTIYSLEVARSTDTAMREQHAHDSRNQGEEVPLVNDGKEHRVKIILQGAP